MSDSDDQPARFAPSALTVERVGLGGLAFLLGLVLAGVLQVL